MSKNLVPPIVMHHRQKTSESNFVYCIRGIYTYIFFLVVVWKYLGLFNVLQHLELTLEQVIDLDYFPVVWLLHRETRPTPSAFVLGPSHTSAHIKSVVTHFVTSGNCGILENMC
jgi:hypothetical protein